MTRPKRLEPAELANALVTLPHWTYDGQRGGTISREYAFADFVDAFGFMTQVALLAERHGHHPEWRNVYRRVWITLTTHDAAGLTSLDIELARAIDARQASRPTPGAADT